MLIDLKEITLEITNRCNLRCKICNIWKEKDKKDLTLKECESILNGLKNKVSICLTGGEPFLSPYIDEIYKYLFHLFFSKRVKSINISTNAYSEKILEFLRRNKKYLLPLSLSISLDGIGKIHNLQRGRKDAFENTIKNILIIKKYNIPLNLKFVISKINYKDLMKTYTLSKKIGTFLYIKFAENIPNYYHRENNPYQLDWNKKEMLIIKKLIDEIYRIEQNSKSKIIPFSLSCIRNLIEKGNLRFIKSCLTPKYSLFITCYGKVYNCLYQKSIGEIKDLPNLNWVTAEKNLNKGKKGVCPKCLSYHGYLKEFNIN